jgi:hypothetical protein
MPVFVVSYDLNREKDYQRLWDALTALEGRRILYSQWVVYSPTTAEALRDTLARFIDRDDSLLVMDRDSRDWGATNLMTPLRSYHPLG